MPDDRISTLNATGDTDGGQKPDSGEPEGGASSIPEAPSNDPDFVSTIHPADTDPEGANNTGDQEKGTGDDKGVGSEEDKGEKKPDSDDDRFDKHPRFQELKTARDEAVARADRLEERLDKLISDKTGGSKDGEEGAKSLMDLDDDDIRDRFDDDPKGFLSDLVTEIRGNVFQELESKSETDSQRQAVIETIDSFASERPDFDEMWDRKEIQNFIAKHPGHNSISAYWALKADDIMSKEEHEKVVKQEIEKDRANRGHKQLASTQGAGASGARAVQAQAGSPELKDTKSGGGRTSVLLNRLRQRRAQASA